MSEDVQHHEEMTLRPHTAEQSRHITHALYLWLILAVAVGLKTYISPDLHTVYPKLAIRALDWWSGQPMYVKHDGVGRFPYAPMFAIAMTPFAVLGNTVGGILWVWCNMGVYLLGLRRCVRDVLPGDWSPKLEAAFLLLAMIGAFRGFWNAQSNALIIGCLMLAASAIARRRWWIAVVLLAAPVFIKVWPIAISLLFVVMWLRSLGWRFAVVMVAGAVLPFVTQSFDVVVAQHRDWLNQLEHMRNEVIGTYHDVWTLLRYFEAPISEGVFRIIQLATGGAILGWCLWQRRLKRDTRWLLTGTLGLGTAWTMILGPAVEYNTYVVLAPAISWALLTAFMAKRGQVLICIAFTMTMFLGMGSIQRFLQDNFPPAYFVMPAGALLFAIWMVLYTSIQDANKPEVTVEP